MPGVWPIGTLLDNLKANLDEVISGTATYHDVEVFTGPPTPEEMPDNLEAIILGVEINTDEAPAALGDNPMRNEEENIIECFVSAYEIQHSDGETATQAARDRALGIFGLVETQLRQDPYQDLPYVRTLHIGRKSMDQGTMPDLGGRICVIEFDIKLIIRTDVPA